MSLFWVFMITWLILSIIVFPLWLSDAETKIAKWNTLTIWAAATLLIIIILLAEGTFKMKI